MVIERRFGGTVFFLFFDGRAEPSDGIMSRSGFNFLFAAITDSGSSSESSEDIFSF